MPYPLWVTENAWNGNAVSVALMAYDGEYGFRVGSCIGISIGLAPEPGLGDPTRCTHGFLFSPSSVSITERGIVIPVSSPLWSRADQFAIRRVEGVVTYWRNEILLHTSTTLSTTEMRLDAALYGDQDEVLGLTFSPILTGGMARAGFPALSAKGTEDQGIGVAHFPDLRLVAASATVNAAAARWPRLTALGGDASDRAGSSFPALTVFGSSLAAPHYEIGTGLFSPISAFGSEAEAGTATGKAEFPLLVTRAIDATDSGISAFPWLCAPARAAVVVDGLLFGVLPTLSGPAVWSQSQLTVPPPDVWVRATAAASGVAHLAAPAPAWSAMGGATIRVQPPIPNVTASVVVQDWGGLRAVIVAPKLRATGGSVRGDGRLRVPGPALGANGGGELRLTMPVPALCLAATARVLGRLRLLMPAPQMAGRAEWERIGIVHCLMVAPLLRANTRPVNRLTAPPPRLSLGSQDGPPATTWAVNVATGAVTELQVGPVIRWSVVGEKLYGLLANGTLFCMTGDTDNGLPIAWQIRFAPSHFGTNNLKRLDVVYLNAHLPDGVVMEVMADETEVWRYPVEPSGAPATGTYRAQTGKGLRFHTAALTLRGHQPASVGGLEVLTFALSRRPK